MTESSQEKDGAPILTTDDIIEIKRQLAVALLDDNESIRRTANRRLDSLNGKSPIIKIFQELSMDLSDLDKMLFSGRLGELDDLQTLSKADLAVFLTDPEEIIRVLAKRKYDKDKENKNAN